MSIFCPHVISLLSYIQDDAHFLSVIEGLDIPPSSWLVAIDVEALYCLIPHSKGIKMVKSFLWDKSQTQWPYNQFILDVFKFILTHIVFVFNRSHYLQIQGVAMGTCCAPSYANLYLGGGRRNYSPMRTSLYTCAIFYHVFVVWDADLSLLQEFLLNLNSNNLSVKFMATTISP